MARLTGSEISSLNSMCRAAGRGSVGTRIDAIEGIVTTDSSDVQGIVLTDTSTGNSVRITVADGSLETEIGTMSDAGVWTPA